MLHRVKRVAKIQQNMGGDISGIDSSHDTIMQYGDSSLSGMI